MKLLDASFFLHELAAISAGYPFRGKIDALPEGNVAVIQMRNADPDAGIDWDALSHVELPRASEKSHLRAGDIILSTRGGRNFPYLITECSRPAVCSPHFFVIRVQAGEILPEFLVWQMRQKPCQDHFATGATGSYILNLTRDVVAGLPVVVPPLETQHLIVGMDAAAKAERALLTQLIDNRANEVAAIARQLLAPAVQNPEQRVS
jgi:hypothetical protein